MRVWTKNWRGRCSPEIYNFILVWTVPPVIGFILGFLMEIHFLGLALGIIYSIIKTMYDYVKVKYEDAF